MTDPQLTFFERTRVQMEYTVPLLRDLQDILGEQLILDALAERLRRRRERAASGATPRQVGDTHLVASFETYADGDALEYQVLADEADTFDLDVTRCAYAELMDELGAADVGDLLICGEDHVLVARAGTRLDRSQTRMLGASHCDFRFSSGETSVELS